MSGFNVIKPGFLSTVQDAGRFGYQQYGLSPSGAMDSHAYRWGNYLLGNTADAACLEITFGQCQLEASADTYIVVTGAQATLSIDTIAVPLWQTVAVQKGALISINNVRSGVRNYLCVLGGLQTKSYFGSRSVCLRDQIGQPIQAHDTLAFKALGATLPTRSAPAQFIPDYQAPVTLRVLPTYQYEQFSQAQRQQFFSKTYTVSNQANRTGYQLQGKAIADIPTSLPSEGMTSGAIQITQEGLPIVMMAEHPTIGGYPKIGSVAADDLARLAQASPHTALHFSLADFKDTCQQHKNHQGFFSTTAARHS